MLELNTRRTQNYRENIQIHLLQGNVRAYYQGSHDTLVVSAVELLQLQFCFFSERGNELALKKRELQLLGKAVASAFQEKMIVSRSVELCGGWSWTQQPSASSEGIALLKTAESEHIHILLKPSWSVKFRASRIANPWSMIMVALIFLEWGFSSNWVKCNNHYES